MKIETNLDFFWKHGLISKLLQTHLDFYFQLLEEMLDNGFPLATELNILT